MTPRDYDGDRPVWDWTMRPDGVAVLTMPGWALYDSKWDWRAGSTTGSTAWPAHRGLVDRPARQRGRAGLRRCDPRAADRPAAGSTPARERRVRFRRTPAALDPLSRYVGRQLPHARRRRASRSATASSRQRRPTCGRRRSSRSARASTLPVAALVGPVNSSATFQFADKRAASGRIRLFGETTGGNRRGINGGCFFFVRLPASGIEFDLPLIGYFPPGHPPDAGIEPDVRVARPPPTSPRAAIP